MKKELLICIFLLNCFSLEAISASAIRQIVASDFYEEPNNASILTLNSPEDISYIPRLYAAGYAGDDLVGQIDFLIPLYLTNDNAFIAYSQGRYSSGNRESWEKDTWTGSGGLLYRQIINDTAVLGAYVLGDYNQSHSGHRYWSVGPGIESLGRTWDFRLNGYIPIDDKISKNEVWAQEIGDYSYVEFQEGTNNVYDHRFAYYEKAGLGGDAEIGRKLFKAGNTLIKGYLQGYYYNMDHNGDITGGGVKVTAQPSRYLIFSANDTYDNYNHNTFMLGAQIRLNDLFNKSNKPIDENNLSTRLLDPIDRNFGTIGSGVSTPLINKFSDIGKGLFSPNGVFFDYYGSGYHSSNQSQYAKGTYGNPYTKESDLYNYFEGMQGMFNAIRGQFSGQVYMYFAPGNYYTSTGRHDAITGPVMLPEGMNMLGRNYWYTTPVYGDDRALFMGAFQFMSNNSLDSIRIQNEPSVGTFDQGIYINAANNVSFNNVQIGSAGTNDYLLRSVHIKNSSNVVFNNSQIYSYKKLDIDNAFASGLKIDGSMVTFGDNNIIVASARTIGNDSLGYAMAEVSGIHLLNSSIVNFGSNNNITAEAFGGISYKDSEAYSYLWINASTLNILGNNNNFMFTAIGGDSSEGDSDTNNAVGWSDGFYASNAGIINISGSNNTFEFNARGGLATNVNGLGDANSFAGGVLFYLNDGSSLNVTGNGNIFKGTGTGNNAIVGSGNANAGSYIYLIYANADPLNVINIGSSNFISVNAQGGNATSASNANNNLSINVEAYGIWVEDGRLIVGDNNNISVIAKGGIATGGTNAFLNAEAMAYGVIGGGNGAIDARIAFGGNNSVLVFAKAGEFVGGGLLNGKAYSVGIEIDNGTLKLKGGSNAFSSISLGNLSVGSVGEANGIDIYGDSSVVFSVDVGTGNNIFELYGNTKAWGFYNENSSSTIYKGAEEIATVSDLRSFFDINSYATFNNSNSVSGGNMIEWGTNSCPWGGGVCS